MLKEKLLLSKISSPRSISVGKQLATVGFGFSRWLS